MQVDLDTAVAQALRAVRAFLAFARHAEETGVMPAVLTASMAESVKVSAARLEQAARSGVPVRPPLLASVVRECVVDLRTLVELSELLDKYDATPRNVLYLAGAMRYTAEKASKALVGVEQALRSE